MTEESPRVARYQSLRDYVAVLRRYWLLILIIAVIGAAAGFANAARQKDVYQSTAQVAFQDPTQNLNLVGIGANTVQTPAALAELNATTATGPGVMSQVRRRLKSRRSAQALAGAVTTTVTVSSGLLQIAADASTPSFAAKLANTVADVVVAQDNRHTRSQFRQVANGIQGRIARLKLRTPSAAQLSFYEDELARLQTLSAFATSAQVAKPAPVPSSPSSPKKGRDTAVGLLLGLLLGVIAAFVRDSMDRRLRTTADLESVFELPVIGHLRNHTMGRVAYMTTGEREFDPLDLESFRILRRNLEFLDYERPPRSVMVTSAVAEEGKTTVAASLALVTAAAGKRVLLVDCDLRRPDVAGRLAVEQSPGISEYLAGAADLSQIRRTVSFAESTHSSQANTAGNGAANGLGHTLECIPAGAVTSRGAELLSTRSFEEFLEQMTVSYDLVVLDSSPLLPVADSLEILPRVESVILCARESQTTRDQALAARAALRRFPPRPTGVVVTGMKPRGADYEVYAYSYSYS